MREWIEIGSAPVEEECAQIGEANYRDKALAECRLFMEEIENHHFDYFGESLESRGCKLRVKATDHDFGRYYEVAIGFSPDCPVAGERAYWVIDNSPARWSDAAMEMLADRMAAIG